MGQSKARGQELLPGHHVDTRARALGLSSAPFSGFGYYMRALTPRIYILNIRSFNRDFISKQQNAKVTE